MKNYLFFILAISIFISCTPPHKSDETKTESSTSRTLITSCIESTFILRDTTQIKNLAKENGDMEMFQYSGATESYLTFLTEPEFRVILESVNKLKNNPQSFLFWNINDKPLTRDEVAQRMMECDSVVFSEFDSKGKETIKTIWACDSISIPNNINMIKFYEAWYVNNETNLIEKEMLGYGVFVYSYSRKGYKHLFYAFKDSISREKAKYKLAFI
ncbi:MAG: hypothetical protein JNK50_07535 [Bacteroidia bacterium]|nr:hypothetical protein [Bacteroidia bacterium]